MNCGNNFCIYEEDGVCCLDQIGIDSLGFCDQCINISINDEMLSALKGKARDRIMKIEEISRIKYPTIYEMIKSKK
ncbi:MAG: hypothetical protein IJY33_03650 [Oscillospiraceae bacterium]|nr:hypothetical protein [Oscillospiraceae bacterium]